MGAKPIDQAPTHPLAKAFALALDTIPPDELHMLADICFKRATTRSGERWGGLTDIGRGLDYYAVLQTERAIKGVGV